MGVTRCELPIIQQPGSCAAGCNCPSPSMVVCSTDTDCGAHGHCVDNGPFGVGCASVAHCMPSCIDTGCADGSTCNEVTSACDPTACDAGYTCPAGMHCAVGSQYVDEHGCEPLSCEQGYACRDGYTCRPQDPNAFFGCSLVRCDEPDGFECPVNFDCMADAPGKGCKQRSCEADGDCECGACLDALCVSRPGVCVPLAVTGG